MTLAVQEAVFPPTTVVAVMVAFPVEIAVTDPVAFTVATDGLLLSQLISVMALVGIIVADNDSLLPGSNITIDLFNDTLDGGVA